MDPKKTEGRKLRGKKGVIASKSGVSAAKNKWRESKKVKRMR